MVLAGLFLCLFGIAELLYYKFRLKARDTRKIVHAGTGLLTMLFPVMIKNHWLVLLLCTSFAVILLISLRYDLLRSVHDVDRVSYGSLWYPAAVYGCYLFYSSYQHGVLFFYLPVLTMAICDPVAAAVGKKWPYGKYRPFHDNKTIMGSAAFFFSSVVLTMVVYYFFSSRDFHLKNVLPLSLLIGIPATIAEGISPKGSDNITIPLCVAALLPLLYD